MLGLVDKRRDKHGPVHEKSSKPTEHEQRDTGDEHTILAAREANHDGQ